MGKKLLIITLLFSLLLITGCESNGIFNSNKTMTCIKEVVDSDGYKNSETMEITYNKSKIIKVKSINIMETDPSLIEMQLNFGTSFAENFSKIDGVDVNYAKVDNNKIKMTTEVEYSKINPEQIKKVLGVLYSEDDSIYGKSEYRVDEFKAEKLDGYTCK